MDDEKCMLTLNWQSKHGVSQQLYLGYNNEDKLDCVTDKSNALIIDKSEVDDILPFLAHKQMWTTEIITTTAKEETNANE